MKNTAHHPRTYGRARSPVSAGLIAIALLAVAPATLANPLANAAWSEFGDPPRVTCPLDSPLPRPLIDAAACGDLQRLRAHLEQPRDLTATDARPHLAGRSALHHAAQRGDPAAVALLLDAGANPNAIDVAGNTPLHLLVSRRATGTELMIARRLLAAGADARLRNARRRSPAETLAAFEMSTLRPLRSRQDALRSALAAAEAAGPLEVAPVAIPAAAAPPPSEPEASPAEPSASAPTAVVEAPAAGSPPPAPAKDSSTAVRAVLSSWAAAWSAGDVAAYLAHYSSHFKPADGNSLEAWRAQRRERVGRPGTIQVTLSDVEIAIEGARAQARFTQDYRSETFKVVDRKLLVLVAEATNWKIVEERAVD